LGVILGAKTLKRSWLAAVLLVGSSMAAIAQGTPTAEEARERLKLDRANLEAAQRRSKQLKADVGKIAGERERINARLIETGRLIHQSEKQLTLIESRLSGLEAQERDLRKSLEQRRGSISALLAAMQRMGRNPPPVMVTRREDALGMVRSAMLLAAAYPELRGQAVELAGELKKLTGVMTSIRTEGERLRTETERLNAARFRLASLQESKRQTLSERQAELAEVGRVASEISQRVEGLSDLISKLDKEVAERTGLGTYEQEIAAKGGTAVDGEPAPVVLAPAEERTAMLVPGRIKPAIPFPETKGLLPLPAQGRRALNFGEKTQYGSLSKGIVIETRPGGQVVSPTDGWIVYAGEFRSYGQLLIINAGGGYHILLAGLSQIDVQLGQFVLAGEAVGVMSAAANSPQKQAQDSAPVLYVEFRKDQRSIDPEPWWADGSRKVQG
jgi:septal ring factor EnvC (AmiA/AmiB activator)